MPRVIIGLSFFLFIFLISPPWGEAEFRDSSQVRTLERAFVAVAKKIQPVVVNITVERTVEEGKAFSSFDKDFFKGTPFENLFEDLSSQRSYRPKQKNAGSGVTISPSGYILTNNHVIEAADKIMVKLSDGRKFKALIIGQDIKTDLAVIKISANELPTAKLGNSDALEVAQWVLAVGNPFGLEQTVTIGVVSAKGRSGLGTGTFEDFIQTDASINPGNSGGPLVNLNGEVVGINTMIIGMGTGISFAIPINLAKNIGDDLIKYGEVRRPWVGLEVQDLTSELVERLGIKEETGILVSRVYPDTPAEKAGLMDGDVIITLDGQSIKEANELLKRIMLKKIGSAIKFEVIRGSGKKEIIVYSEKLSSNREALERDDESK